MPLRRKRLLSVPQTLLTSLSTLAAPSKTSRTNSMPTRQFTHHQRTAPFWNQHQRGLSGDHHPPSPVRGSIGHRRLEARRLRQTLPRIPRLTPFPHPPLVISRGAPEQPGFWTREENIISILKSLPDRKDPGSDPEKPRRAR